MTRGVKSSSYVDGVSKLGKLLDETYEAYYWAGFLCADGSMDTKRWRMKLALATKDESHLQKFCTFVNAKSPKKYRTSNGYYAFEVRLQDADTLPKFSEKFGMVSRKTYLFKAPKIEDSDLFMSFFAGFLDGNGKIEKMHNRADAQISLTGHGNVLSCHLQWADRIYKMFPPTKTCSAVSSGAMPRLDQKGYSRWTISNSETVVEIKKSLAALELPLLQRKWQNINTEAKLRYLETKKRRERFLDLRLQGRSLTEIALVLGVSYSAVYKYKKELERPNL